ncbi:F-box protein At5g03100 [Sorghum bicolor]|uniref:F-box protein At5g03100 n=1 Tax=Sorghum bicolor TaxID=4558 RepID=UPI000B423E78|nr:F-box protein At5g03100 [Sorghum bicolor]|eukprot:XP_021316673.1 F-box protein At5g03100 [Sorghum bicolor]
MPKRSRENCGALAVAGNDDRLGSLPDDALLHVLSLLPSEDAARTCVLARRWRHLWRFTAALRIARDDDKRWSVRWLHRFVTNLLRLRDSLSPLDVCDIFCRPFVWYRGGHAAQALCFKVAEEWVRRVVSEYRARVLKHLTRVELGEVELGSRILDLSDCLALEHLELISCRIQGERMLFPSVKHLRITNSSFCIIPRSSISENWGFTPVLESMPSLAKAFVQFDDECCDKCPIEIIMGIVVLKTVMDAMGISIMRMTKTMSVSFLGVCQTQRIWS